MSRRNFIKAGTMTLTIPFLESLPLMAQAQTASGSLKRVLFFCISNAWYESQIFPANPTYLTGAEGVRYMPLANISGDISPMFTAAKYGALKSKMNLMRGFDLTEGAQGGHDMLIALGASSEKSASPVKDTIDTVIANSSQFYPTTPYRRSLNCVPVKDGATQKYNYSYQNGNQRSLLQGPSAIFSDFFSGTLPSSGGGTTTPTDTNLSRRIAMNTALAKISSLASSTKLSAADRQKLSQHADMINGLLPGLAAPTASTSVNVGAGCVKPTIASGINESMTSSSGNQVRIRACLDQIYMAFNCQLTNMAYMHPVVAYDSGNWDMGDTGNDAYHQLAGHHYAPDKYLLYKGWVFDQLLYLLNLMDGTKESNGLSMLDNSLVVVVSNDACSIHSYQDMPVITFGSLGGKIKTGNYINYQRTDAPKGTGELELSPAPNAKGEYYYRYNYNLGRPLASFYTTLLNVLGISNSGYGNYVNAATNYSQFVTDAAKKASLPILV